MFNEKKTYRFTEDELNRLFSAYGAVLEKWTFIEPTKAVFEGVSPDGVPVRMIFEMNLRGTMEYHWKEFKFIVKKKSVLFYRKIGEHTSLADKPHSTQLSVWLDTIPGIKGDIVSEYFRVTENKSSQKQILERNKVMSELGLD